MVPPGRGILLPVTEIPAPPGTTDLLRHAAWLRDLAHSLCRDPHAADDLGQETLLRFLQHPPRHAGNLRGFLGTVARNLWRQDRRTEARRARREADFATAAPTTAPATDDIVARADAHRLLVAHVLDLAEPYRSTILLRFFDGHSVRAIAAQQAIPVATVETRLRRALQRLRERLGPGGPAALLPLLHPPAPGLPAAIPLALLMNTKLLLTTGALALGAVLAWQFLTPPPATLAGPGTPTTTHTVATGERPGPGEAATPGAERSAADPLPDPAAAAAPVPTVAPVTVAGRLCDAEGRPLADRPVVFRAGSEQGQDLATFRTGPDGTFTAAFTGNGRLLAGDPDLITVLMPVLDASAPPPHALVVAATAVRLTAVVADQHGAPLAGATTAVVLPEGFRGRFRDNADAATTVAFHGRSDGEGRVHLDAPAVPGATLLTTLSGHLPDRRPLPARDQELRVTLHRPTRAEGAIAGQVLAADGSAVADAWVSLGGDAGRTDEHGNFTLTDGGKPLLAAKAGLPPVRLERPDTGWPDFVLVWLPALPQTIRGRVLDEHGEPLAGIKVWVTDPTAFARLEGSGALTEGLASGALTMSAAMAELRASGERDPQEFLRRTPVVMWPWTRTDERGEFTLTGLLERSYDLRAMRDENLLWADLPGVRAGSAGVEMRLPTAACFGELAGRVVTGAGQPVPGVRVALMGDVLKVGGNTMHAQAMHTRSDAEGRFVLREVPHRHAYLRLDGESILPLEYGRGVDGGLLELAGARPTEVTVTVSVRVHVQVELARPDLATALRVLDGNGRRLDIDVFEGRSRSTYDELQLQDGRTPVFVVPDAAVTLVLMRQDGTEAQRHPLVLVPGDVNRLRF